MMKKEIHLFTNRLLKPLGFELMKLPYGQFKKRLEILKQYQFDLILDVGANIGQYAQSVFQAGYTGKIVSVEPVGDAFRNLTKKTDHHKRWKAFQMALGDFDGSIPINVSKNSASSSIMDINETHLKAAPDSVYISKENVPVFRLDSVIQRLTEGIEFKRIFLKIDTQGYEKKVLDGAQGVLSMIDGIQLEMSLVELYNGECTYLEMIEFMKTLGFQLFSIEVGYSNPATKQLLQIDGIFLKKEPGRTD
jgi:FkbM family methyltransferase